MLKRPKSMENRENLENFHYPVEIMLGIYLDIVIKFRIQDFRLAD